MTVCRLEKLGHCLVVLTSANTDKMLAGFVAHQLEPVFVRDFLLGLYPLNAFGKSIGFGEIKNLFDCPL